MTMIPLGWATCVDLLHNNSKEHSGALIFIIIFVYLKIRTVDRLWCSVPCLRRVAGSNPTLAATYM